MTTPALDPEMLLAAAEAACRAGLRAGLAELDARDLAQEAMMRALTTARPPPDVALAAWVYGIARNLGRDHRKAAQRRELLVRHPSAPPMTISRPCSRSGARSTSSRRRCARS